MKEYQKTDFKGFRLRIHKGMRDKNLLEKCCRQEIEEDHDFHKVSSSLYSRVFRFSYNHNHYFYKIFLDRSIFEPLKNLVRGSRGQRSLRGEQLLLKYGFNAPRCIMIGEKENLNFCVWEAVPNARDLNHFIKKKLPSELNREQVTRKNRLICKLGQVIGQLHARGISHGDLRWGNVLIQDCPSSSINIWFLDNERTSYHGRRLPDKKRLKNLVQINMALNPAITDADRVLFLNVYLREDRKLLPRRYDLAAEVQTRTELRLAKYKNL